MQYSKVSTQFFLCSHNLSMTFPTKFLLFFCFLGLPALLSVSEVFFYRRIIYLSAIIGGSICVLPWVYSSTGKAVLDEHPINISLSRHNSNYINGHIHITSNDDINIPIYRKHQLSTMAFSFDENIGWFFRKLWCGFYVQVRKKWFYLQSMQTMSLANT